MSPRRSSRARATQLTPSAPQHTNSSSSSISSGRADRSVHPQNKLPSPRHSSVAARSQSSEDPEAPARTEPRRTRSSQDDPKNGVPPETDDDNDEDVEEEVTRCICGNQEYPGLPDPDPAKTLSKDESDPASFAEDTTGWFIQCDICKVWQHGGCVGITDEATSPEEYFCEQCRKDLHKITTTSNGRKYTCYLPVREPKSLLSSPVPATKENSKKSGDGRKSLGGADSTSKGRRSTMNSRDAAYEEEQLRRAIEESKREGGRPGTSTGRRKGKRSRSESEERNGNAKRQRTTSGSASSASRSKNRRDAESENEIEKPDKTKNIRGAAARNHRNKEVRDREALREKERVDAQGGRKGRAERRRGDESDPSPQPVSRTLSARGANMTNALFATPALPDHPQPKTVQKKTGRPPAKRGRVGRNQYTKDRDLPAEIPITTTSPARSNNSHDAENGTSHLNGSSTGGGFADSNGFGKPSKPRYMNFNRTSMNDMKRRVAGILEFISHTQVEMTGLGPPSTTKSSTSTNTPPESNGNRSDEQGDGSKHDTHRGRMVNAALADLDGINEQAFAALSSVVMMEVLTRRLMKWQAEYGKWGEK